LIALSGSFEVVLTTDTTKFIYFKQAQQLHIPPGIWRVRKLFFRCNMFGSCFGCIYGRLYKNFDEFMDSKDEATLHGSQYK
jgi:hypothetical protein